MDTIKKYFPAAIFSVAAMYAVTIMEVAYQNSATPDAPTALAVNASPLGILYGAVMFLLIFLASLLCVKIASRVLSSRLAGLILAGMIYTALGAALFLKGSGAPLQYYFPENWAIDFQFFAISYAFIRIADIREKRRK